MSSRDMAAFIGHVVMAMRFVADFIAGESGIIYSSKRFLENDLVSRQQC